MKTTFGRIVAIAGMASAISLGGQLAQAGQAMNGEQARTGLHGECGCRYHHHHHGWKEGLQLKGKGRHHRLARIAERLDLSQEQREKVKDIFEKNRQSCEPLRKELRDAKLKLRMLTMADKTDEAAIRSQAEKLATIEGDLAIHRAGVMAEMKGVLKAEQLQKFKELQEKR